LTKRTMNNKKWRNRSDGMIMVQAACLILLLAGRSWSMMVAAQAPPNDACSDATVVSTLPFTQTGSTSGSAAADFTVENCGEAFSGVWYTYTPTATKIVSVLVDHTSGGSVIVLRVFSGGCDVLECLHWTAPVWDAIHEWIAHAGVQYHVLVSPSIAEEALAYNIEFNDLEVPSNDECTLATLIESLPYVATGSPGALPDFNETMCEVASDTNGVWYTYTPNENKIVTIAVSYTGNAPTVLRVFSGTCDPPYSCVGTSGPSSSWNSGLTWIAEAGVTYKFLVSSSSFTTELAFNIDVWDYDVPPSDSCEAATKITAVPYQIAGNTAGALPSLEEDKCGVSSAANGLWYTYTPGETKMLQVVIEHVNAPTVLRVFLGGCDILTCLIPVAGASSSWNSLFFWIGEANVTYHSLVDGGDFHVGLVYNAYMKDFPIPTNDDCTGATLINSLPFIVEGTTEGALPDFEIDLCTFSSATNGVWYEYVGDGGEVELVIASNITRLMTVRIYSGDCTSGICELATSFWAELTHAWIAKTGFTYQILISEPVFAIGFPFSIKLSVRALRETQHIYVVLCFAK
jgi:hypothetical protein